MTPTMAQYCIIYLYVDFSITRNGDIDDAKKNNAEQTEDMNTNELQAGSETKSKRRFKGKRCRPRKKSNANADQVKRFEEKMKGCHDK